MTEETRAEHVALGPFRFVARPSTAPLGLILGLGAAGVALVGRLLQVDRFPYTLCGFKAITGLPCPTCGTTRCLVNVARLDLRGAFEMNPLIFALGLCLVAWAIVDTALWVRRRSLVVELRKGWGIPVAVFAAAFAAVNWIHLVMVGR